LHETAEHHDPYEKAAPPHDWWDWYAVYMDARRAGSTPAEASAAAGQYALARSYRSLRSWRTVS
jgi:hypothetical protein